MDASGNRALHSTNLSTVPHSQQLNSIKPLRGSLNLGIQGNWLIVCLS